MTPAPVRAERDAGSVQGAGHGDLDRLGQRLQLNDFGGNLHMRILCADAQMSTGEVCARPWSADPALRRILCAMAKRTASERELAYRQEVYSYLNQVMFRHTWSQSELARQIGVHPSSVNKAVSRKHSMDYSHLLVLADVSEMPLPEAVTITYKSLAGANRVADPLEAQIREIGRQLEERPPEERKALFDELRRLAKVG